ncbi:hypothetical protein AB0K60_15170 [Thermopolyspora sp. NPDC052614]|uniref:hypothetical protein n=1 Tax=Thermopolyspora sp. NPDC052614 TaxID=3155682 RepID=UPI003444FB86
MFPAADKVPFVVSMLLGAVFGLLAIGVGLVPFMALLLIMGWSAAIVSILCVRRFGESVSVIGWCLVFVFQPVVGIFHPVSVLPGGVAGRRRRGARDPCLRGDAHVLSGGAMPWDGLTPAVLLDVGCLAAGLWLYKATLGHACVKGRFARFGG